MKKSKAIVTMLFLCMALLISAGMFMFPLGRNSVADSSAVAGRWLTESGNLEIDIRPCGERLCGTVATVVENRLMNNSQQAMKSADGRSPLGMMILSGFVDTGRGSWKGKIYNRENGKTYDCLMTLATSDVLEIRGYKFAPIIGKTQVWTRASQSIGTLQP